MPRKATDADRMRDAQAAMRSIAAEHRALKATEPTPEDWRRIADLAGQLQRRARLLGGLGRGG